MEVTKLASVEEIAAWMRVPALAFAVAEKMAATAYGVRQTLRGIYTAIPYGIYLRDPHPNTWLVGISAEGKQADDQEVELLKSAISHVVEHVGYLNITDANAEPALSSWVKIAYSPSFRNIGEALNFFPGHYPGGIPNSASPAASMLTSGLVGAGLGYGAGWLGEHALPNRWDRGRLSKTLAMAGGGAGLALGSIPGVANKALGRPFNDKSLFSQLGRPDMSPMSGMAGSATDAPQLGPKFVAACEKFAADMKQKADLAVKEAWGDTFGSQPGTGMAVNIDAMGRTLWETGADPSIAGMTMGALAAAQQMPGGEEQGFVTPMQMGHLAAHMGAGYLSGALVGAALGILTGMPADTQEHLRQTGAYVGIVKAIVPKLFGG